MTRATDRQQLMVLVREATDQGVGLSKACCTVGLSVRTLQRWKSAADDRRPTAVRPAPKNKLSAEEERQVLIVETPISKSSG